LAGVFWNPQEILTME